MTTREDLLKLAEEWKKANPKSKKPRYIVYTFDYPYSMPFNTTETRMFFRWNEKKQGFFQEEEPEPFRGVPIVPSCSVVRNW